MAYLSQGERYDWTTGNFHDYRRDGRPSLETFLETDPSGLSAGNNLYEQEGDNPVDRMDPTGLWTPEGLITAYHLYYGAEGRKLLATALAQGITIRSDKNSFWFSQAEFNKSERAIIIAEREGLWAVGLTNEIPSYAAATLLHAELKKLYNNGYLGSLIQGAHNAMAGPLYKAAANGAFMPEDNEAILAVQQENRLFANFAGNVATSLASDEIQDRTLMAASSGLYAFLLRPKAVRGFIANLRGLQRGIALDKDAKGLIRFIGREIYVKRNGAIAAGCEVHHRVPLEWAHLFPSRNPNAVGNLFLVDEVNHNRITNVWNAWRRSLGGITPTAQAVLDQAALIDRTFGGVMAASK